jgi:DNA-binding transcriptional LysR family regulator
MIDSSQLNVLMAVEKAANLSEAADFLNITQSAVSQNLKTLEQRVGFEVVTRSGKKLALTPNGRKLAKLGRNYFKKLDDAITEILQERNRISGSISIGTMFGIGKSWIAHRMIEFSTHFPDVEVSIKMDFPDQLLKDFENHELDCLVLPEKLIPAHCDYKLLHNEFSTLVFPDSDKFKITTETTLKELSELPLIFFEQRDPLFYQWCRAKYGAVPRNIRPRIVVNAFGQMLQAVNEGLGVAVVPTHVFRRSFYKNKVKTLGKEFDIQSSVFHFIYHNEDKENLKISSLYQFLHSEVEKLNI